MPDIGLKESVIKIGYLDCESAETALDSIATIMGLDQEELSGYLQRLHPDDYWKSDAHESIPADEFILQRVEPLKTISDFEHVSGTCWFHLTRAFSSKDFDRGILPLSQVVDYLWERLFGLVHSDISKSRWSDFRADFEGPSKCQRAILHSERLSNCNQNGLFGILVRDVYKYHEEKSNHNYLDIPEVVEDICICFKKETGISLDNRFRDNTQPYIVKFHDSAFEQGALSSAMCYLWYSLHGVSKPPYFCDYSFSADGRVIPASNILSVERVET